MKVSGLSVSLASQEQNLRQTGRGLSVWATGSILLILVLRVGLFIGGSGQGRFNLQPWHTHRCGFWERGESHRFLVLNSPNTSI